MPSNWLWPKKEEPEAVEDEEQDGGDGDEIADHISKKKGWTFWNRDDKEDEAEVVTPPKQAANRILQSKPSLPDIETPEDDAVLYKPHHKSSQFNQINTHRNENLRENIIVPNWEQCLSGPSSHHTQSTSSLTASSLVSLFGSNSTTNEAQTNNSVIDVKSWRNFLYQLSAKLGFTSQQLTSVVDRADDSSGDVDDNEKVKKEFNLLYERTYKLYGRSLAKLPPHKKGCLPNYSKVYEEAEDDVERDDADENEDSISITNDPMGNLLINHRKAYRSQTIHTPEVVSQKVGALQKIKKILVIGVHGFFPHKMIRPIIGAPKGTSLKFANEAEKGILRYCIDNGMMTENDSNSVSIQKIALEKEGKIFDRVAFFTEILSKWENELNEADFIFVASHSQGCVVSIILLAQLIKQGILKNAIKKRIGILGMAGVNNGPFYGVDKSFFMKAYSTIEHESLTELFELSKFDSPQSIAYKDAMQTIVSANVKICFIGSVNDQLVPLYSALASHVFHPNIYRACYIDHSSQTPLFIQKLVSLCCHMQNLGFFDNNVLKELSASLAGTITSGGHSKLYNDGKVYDLGIKFVLDTDDIVIPAKNVPSTDISRLPFTNHVYIKEYDIAKISTNPFILPWCLRGLFFNVEKNWPMREKAKANGYDEVKELYDCFDGWKPETKVHKELKFRLNGIRASKL